MFILSGRIIKWFVYIPIWGFVDIFSSLICWRIPNNGFSKIIRILLVIISFHSATLFMVWASAILFEKWFTSIICNKYRMKLSIRILGLYVLAWYLFHLYLLFLTFFWWAFCIWLFKRIFQRIFVWLPL